MYPIQGIVQNYAWGDRASLATTLGHKPSGLPEAEYWLGAHPVAPSNVRGDTPRIGNINVDGVKNASSNTDSFGTGGEMDLARLIQNDPQRLLGDYVYERFGELPFLLKVLAAGQPLSIQAHPSATQAQKGFERETVAGIDLAAPNRNYRDKNPKPELICALTRFEAKHGFAEISETIEIFEWLCEQPTSGPNEILRELRSLFAKPGQAIDVLSNVMHWLINLSDNQSKELVTQVVSAASGQAPKRFETELRWVKKIDQLMPGDIGNVVGLLLNHVVLEPGQALFLDAGNLHSYLGGVGVELMANSDNVVRCGLTAKHVDKDEFLSVIDFSPAEPVVQIANNAVHEFDVPAPQFSLSRLDGTQGPISGLCQVDRGAEILLVTEGRVEVICGPKTRVCAKGDAMFIGADVGAFEIKDLDMGTSLMWRARVGKPV